MLLKFRYHYRTADGRSGIGYLMVPATASVKEYIKRKRGYAEVYDIHLVG